MSALGARVAAADDVDVNDAPVAFVAACVSVAVAAAVVDVVVDDNDDDDDDDEIHAKYLVRFNETLLEEEAEDDDDMI